MLTAIGLGSSLGNRRARLELTIRQLHATAGLTVIRVSRWYRTPPMSGGTARGWFLNGVALLEAELEPQQILTVCRSLEARAGRRRARFWGDRTLDLDILVLANFHSDDPTLLVPHPAIAQRAFVLLPLLEVWPDAIDLRNNTNYAGLPSPGGPRPIPIGVVAKRAQTAYEGPHFWSDRSVP